VTNNHFGRRILSFTASVIGLPLWTVLTPVWAVISIVADLFGGLRKLPTLRLCLFFLVFLVHDWIGMITATWLWLTGSFGRRLNLDKHRRVQGWWGNSLLEWGGRLLGVRFELDDLSKLPSRTFILLSRHASMIDAVIPVTLVTKRMGRYIHYVLKRELRWVPSMDLFGGRLLNHFVARGADTDAEEAAIEQMADSAIADSALVIFPEGTYATPATRKKVLASLRKKGDDDIIKRAESLDTLLPPKPAGTLAMLRGQPDADVVIIGHVGLEGVAELKGLRSRLPLKRPVLVKWWVHKRSELPTNEDDLIGWLGDRWIELDQWVTGELNKQAA
jgi:1-acyl-sn-glycerol-3-phosphate acyltransferase